MIREFLRNLFSTTGTRGRLEYVGAIVGLLAGGALLMITGFASGTAWIAYPFFLAAMVLHTGAWFVTAQRVRDIGWNVPLFLGAMLIASVLSRFAGVGENGAVVVYGGPFAFVYAALLLLLAVVPGKSRPATVTNSATA